MNSILQEIFKRGEVIDRQGKIRKLNSHISQDAGEWLQQLIRKHKPQRVLEVGCAYGISSLYIAEALKDIPGARHLILDPYQNDPAVWDGIGLKNLEKSGYRDLVDFMETPSEIGLPKLLEEHVKVDFIFLDGFHTFDHTALDFFYSHRLLNVNGILVFDDVQMPAVRKVVRMALSFGCYRVMGGCRESSTVARRFFNAFKSTVGPVMKIFGKWADEIFHPEFLGSDVGKKINHSLTALIKTQEDRRAWDWFHDF